MHIKSINTTFLASLSNSDTIDIWDFSKEKGRELIYQISSHEPNVSCIKYIPGDDKYLAIATSTGMIQL